MNDKKRRPDEPIPARVFVLIPTESSDAIVICRLRAKQVGVFKWDMLTNKIKVSQWMKGRIYEYLSDVSPDGKHFIYSMNHKGWGYTVISKAPWIKAISFWNNVGGWGGGIFLDNKRYMLYDGYPIYNKFIDKSLTHVDRKIFLNDNTKFNTRYNEFHIGNLYALRLLERGWSKESQANNIETFQKKTKKDFILEKIVFGYPHGAQEKGKGTYWESHRLIKNDTIIEKPDWEWCEYRYDTIYYSEKGCLYELKDMDAEPKLIYDFNDEKFVCKVAPY